METGKPLLLMPRDQETFAADRILVGWNGSREAARAVTDALPMLIGATSVIAVATADSAAADPSLKDLENYLALKGVEATTDTLRPKGDHIGLALVEAAKANGADLIVMGGYGRPRMRDMIFGGVTHEILAKADRPVLMAH